MTAAPLHAVPMISTWDRPARARRALSPRVRRAVLTAHIVASVGLLGDVAAVLAVNIRAATTLGQPGDGFRHDRCIGWGQRELVRGRRK
jgi:hypothetical protein